MTKRIFRSICIVSLTVLLAALVLIMGALYDYFSRTQQNQLRTQTQLAARGIAQGGESFLDKLSTDGYRITWIDADGKVLFDTDADAGKMENHLNREEVQLALKDGYGESARYSATLTEQQLYAAQRLDNGTVVRVSCRQQSVLTLVLSMAQPLLVIVVAAILLALVLARSVARHIVQPLNEIDLDNPLANEGYDELSPLLRRINSQQKQLKHQAAALKRRQDEFSAVTGSMSEGLVLLNEDGAVVSINRTAMRLLDTDEYCVGRDILTVNRSLALQQLLQKARQGEHAETLAELHGGQYQLMASPVLSDKKTGGTALLMLDVTEKQQAEQMRREFTANVSHELKTPLHSISGCAELLNNDLVKPEDRAQFTHQIYSEAQRMIRLVDDIIRLSRLDEGEQNTAFEKTDLFAVAQTAVESLQPQAAEAGVSLTLTGETAEINGIPQLLSGIVYNLCDNAIKYNRAGGTVEVEVLPKGSAVLLQVRDTGIGIAPDQQSRVFERFYRVDKSHSKAVGGTGLGLSIVKHAAGVHNAKIDLRSKPGEGTCITVKFAKAARKKSPRPRKTAAEAEAKAEPAADKGTENGEPQA